MVGRAGELNELMRTFDRMKQGRAQLVSLVGEAGRGKSRLIALGAARSRWPTDPHGRPAGGLLVPRRAPYGAPVALQPVREVISGVHILSDLTLGLGTIVHDYLAANQELK